MGAVLYFKGIYQRRRHDDYPIVVTEDGHVYEVSSGSDEILPFLTLGQEVFIYNKHSEPLRDTNIGNYCQIQCPYCKRTHA